MKTLCEEVNSLTETKKTINDYENPEKNPFHKVLTKHGFKPSSTRTEENQFGEKGHFVTHHHYTHPEHGRSHVDIMLFHDGDKHFVFKHEQQNGIVGPYGAGSTKNHLDKALTSQYGEPK
jgi:hypothetical protein